MADRITPEQRSRNMAAVKSRGNTSTELALARFFRKEGITGWRRNKKVYGIRPDFVLPVRRIAVFVHGCFWHGCPKHGQIPKTAKAFWRKKIAANIARDLRQNQELKRNGWITLTVWEHELKKRDVALTALKRSLFDKGAFSQRKMQCT
ncbi:very short patch repair endonuclease [Candidatus Kaiserbacteria bacterium]|nr:very short patch repair endonuclease [Candidatus Kaiserbacteria bacterium]